MPDNLRVSISEGGHYEVSMGNEVNLEVIIVARSRRACRNIYLSRVCVTNYVIIIYVKAYC